MLWLCLTPLSLSLSLSVQLSLLSLSPCVCVRVRMRIWIVLGAIALSLRSCPILTVCLLPLFLCLSPLLPLCASLSFLFIALIRLDEENFLADMKAVMERGSVWEKVAKLCDLKPKQGETADAARFRQLLVQLKNDKTTLLAGMAAPEKEL